MTLEELRDKIRGLALEAIADKKKAEIAAVEYDELTKFPELKKVIVTLLTADFNAFVASIDWVAPRPTTFRVNLKNNEEFYLIWMNRSWIAQVEGKKYYLLNLSEEQQAVESIARILRYGPPEVESSEEDSFDVGGGDVGGGEEEIDINVDDTTDIEV